ncbi:MAG TPA: hypothetical protein VGO66_10250 [Solirubrobacterales bacterium]|jgi:hypothetical protein|nr:hypothetical protein [Solirubrobacterales bacterium]
MAKVLVSFDDDLLRRIDLAAWAAGQSRSAYLSVLAERDWSAGPGGTSAALLELDRLFADALADDVTAAIRAERDAR